MIPCTIFDGILTLDPDHELTELISMGISALII